MESLRKSCLCVLLWISVSSRIAGLNAATTACLDGWIPNSGSCYLFGHGNGMSFFEAQHYCEHFGASLVHIEDVHENRFLMDFESRLKITHFWIGLTDEMVEGEWRWIDTDTRPTFTAWRPGQPNGGSEDCAAIEDTNEWGDYSCDDTHIYPLCEMKGNIGELEVVG